MPLAIRQFGINPDNRIHEPREGYPNTPMGLELEWDDANIPSSVIGSLDYWEPRSEGSLSGSGVELVFTQPYMGEDIHRALDELDRVVIPRVNQVRSPNHSMHCHMDMRDTEPMELVKIILASVAVEPLLFEAFGPDRRRNIFCVSHEDSAGEYSELVGRLLADVLRGQSVQMNRIQRLRYSSVSLASLFRFGSLEFRLANATYDTEVMLKYMRCLEAIKIAARSLPDEAREPKDILKVYNRILARAIHQVGIILGINYKEGREKTIRTRLVVELILESLARRLEHYERDEQRREAMRNTTSTAQSQSAEDLLRRMRFTSAELDALRSAGVLRETSTTASTDQGFAWIFDQQVEEEPEDEQLEDIE